MKAINPATDELIREYKEHSETEFNSIIEASYREHLMWKTTMFAERKRLMHRAAEILRKKRDDYARTISLEMGKLISESKAEVDKCVWVCDYYARMPSIFWRMRLSKPTAAGALFPLSHWE